MFTDECSNAGDAGRVPQARDEAGCWGNRRPGPTAVLIVEDEQVARRALGALLSASGYCASTAGSAEEALRLLEDQPSPRIALVDLNLPGMNGIDFISRLERIDPSVHVVLMTGAGDEALAAALPDRYVPCVRKPLDFSRLLTLISTPPCQQ